MKKLLLLVVLLVLTCSACSVDKITFDQGKDVTVAPTIEPDPSDDWEEGTLLMMAGEPVNYREALLLLLSAKEEAELLYGEGIWDYVLDDEGVTYGDRMREQVLEEFINLKTVCSYADDLNVELSEEEMRNAEDYTAEYIENIGKTNLVTYNLSEGIIKQLYMDNITALKVYESITLSVDTDIPDEEARQIIIQYIMRSKYEVNEEGETVVLTGNKLQMVRDKTEELLAESLRKENFYYFAEMNTEGSDGVEMTVGLGELPKEVEDVAFYLQENEFAGVIETDEWYYIVKCISTFDEDATNARKEEIIEERQKTLFDETFTSWKENTEVLINKNLWGSISVE